MIDEITTAIDWLETTETVILACVTDCWGSAPRRPGSLMVIDQEGRFSGSVSGGCVEGDVVSEAVAMPTATDCGLRALSYGVSDEAALGLGLACGGTIAVTLLRLKRCHAEALKAALQALEGGAAVALTFETEAPPGAIKLSYEVADTAPDGPIVAATSTALTLQLLKAPRLFIIGAVHIAEFLVPMARACAYDITVIDPRGAFVDGRKLAGATVIEDWPDDILKTCHLAPSDALVALTHDPKLDDAALLPAIKANFHYVGALGSRKTHAARKERLLTAGADGHQVGRISGPIGLDIGAKTPAEIAVSILAEMIKLRRST